MALVQDWSQGQSSDCPTLGCTTVSGGLLECQKSCQDNFDCNLINFCTDGADCTSGLNRCCLRKCKDDDYKLTNHWKGWDIYVKGMYSVTVEGLR